MTLRSAIMARVRRAHGLNSVGVVATMAMLNLVVLPLRASEQTHRPPPRTGHMAVAVDSRLHVAGGYAIKSGLQSRLDYLSPADASWTALPAMPRGRALGAMVAVDHRLFALGGIGEKAPVPDIDVFNVDKRQWEAPLAHEALPSRFAAVALGDDIYIIGGLLAGTKDAAGIHSRRVESFNTRSGEWKRRADLQTGRHAHAAAVLDGRIHVSGGYIAHGEHAGQTASVEVYDPKADRWHSAPSLQRPHAFHGMVVLLDRLHVFGTRGEDRSMEILDLAGQEWRDGPPMPLARHRFACGVIGQRLYVIDGEDERGDTQATIVVFDAAVNTWSVLTEPPPTSMPASRIPSSSPAR